MIIILDIIVFYIISKHSPLTTTSQNFVANGVRINQSYKVFVLWLTHTSQFRSCIFSLNLRSRLGLFNSSLHRFPLVQPGIACNNTSQGSKVHRGLGPGQSAPASPGLAERERGVRTQSKFLYDQPNWFIDEEECLQIKTISECKQIFTSAKLIRRKNN